MKDEIDTRPKPDHATELTPALVKYLDGLKLSERVGEAISISTVDADGWPHAAILSVGEVLAIDKQHLRFAIWAKSGTVRNIERTGLVSLALAHEGGLWEIHLKAKRIADQSDSPKLAFFNAEIKDVRIHKVDYADVMANVTYRLHEPEKVIKRWSKQIEELRTAA